MKILKISLKKSKVTLYFAKFFSINRKICNDVMTFTINP